MLKKLPPAESTLVRRLTETLGPGEIHGFGSAALQECDERALQQGAVAPATLHHSGDGLEKSTNPSQVTSPNVEQNQPQETTSVKQPSPDEVSHGGKKRIRCTPKSEAAQVGTKEEPTEPDSEEPAGPEEQKELRRMMDAFPFAPSSDSTPRQSEATRGPTGLLTPKEPEGLVDRMFVEDPRCT